MKLQVVAGPPSSGKTSIILQLIAALVRQALCAAGPGVRYPAGKEAALHYAIGGMQLLHRGTAHRGKLPDGNVKENGV